MAKQDLCEERGVGVVLFHSIRASRILPSEFPSLLRLQHRLQFVENRGQYSPILDSVHGLIDISVYCFKLSTRMAPTVGAETASTPTHPDRIRVIRSSEPFGSSAESLVNLPPGTLFARITTATPASRREYDSVQTGRDTHIKLNSDLVFCNHSCQPSLIFDMARMEVRVVKNRPLQVGDVLTFFYPSTEWELDQPFHCACGVGDRACKGWISGAKTMSREELEDYWLNDYINVLLDERDKD
jgi:hypothetical protein